MIPRSALMGTLLAFGRKQPPKIGDWLRRIGRSLRQAEQAWTGYERLLAWYPKVPRGRATRRLAPWPPHPFHARDSSSVLPATRVESTMLAPLDRSRPSIGASMLG